MPDNLFWYCSIGVYIALSCTLCSNLFIISMTFQRFYSIIQPHKAASFNTVKRAKITIASVIIFSLIFRCPHLFTTKIQGRYCILYGKILGLVYGKLYYWATLCVNFLLPFISLLIMNSVIIRTLHKRTQSNLIKSLRSQDQGQSEGHIKNTDEQIYTMLLLVTFSYLILTTPAYIMLLYINLINPFQSAYHYAAYILFVQVGEKACYTNFGINFFLYVLSGQKFRKDLVDLFVQRSRKNQKPAAPSTDVHSPTSSV